MWSLNFAARACLGVYAALHLCVAQDVNEIVARFLEAQALNAGRANRYTYTEQEDHFSFDKSGQLKKTGSETRDVIFVEGDTYRKLTARNGRPLTPKEQAREDRKLQLTAEERRKARQSGVFHKTVSLGSDRDLLTLFDNRIAGEEEIRGRKAWVIECTPKSGIAPASPHERELMSFRRKLWIDQAEYAQLRSIHTVIGEHVVLAPGATIEWNYEKIAGEAWLPAGGVIDGRLHFAKLIKPAVRTEYTYSHFQKFDVQSTVTVTPEPRQ